MKKKFLIGLPPLLVTLAFLAMTGTSQALFSKGPCVPGTTQPTCPHVYKNGVAGVEGKKVREISWGTLKLKNSTLGEVICHNIFAGFATNPAGGGNASGEVQAFFPYECESASCILLGGKGIAVKAGKMPWVAEAIEPSKAGEFWQKTGFKGPTKNKKPNEITEPGFIEFNVNCIGVSAPDFFGENDSLVLNNGLAIGSGPGELQLFPEKSNANSHDLESEGIVGPGETEGFVKVEGYGAEELVEVKNP